MNDWEFIAPMVMGVTAFISVAAVLIFRPLTKRLGDLIEAISRDRQAKLSDENAQRVISIVEQLGDRVEQMEERLDFTERMLASADRQRKGSTKVLSEHAEH